MAYLHAIRDATRVSRKTWVASPETQIAPPAAIPAAPAGRAVPFRNERRVIRFAMVDLLFPSDVGRAEPRRQVEHAAARWVTAEQSRRWRVRYVGRSGIMTTPGAARTLSRGGSP